MVLDKHKIKVILALLSLYLFWGGTYLGMKFALVSFPPFIMAGLRHFLAGSILFLVAFLRKEAFPTRKQILNAVLVGVFLLVGGNGFVSWAGRLVPSSISSIMLAATPIVITLLNSFTGDKHKPSLLEILALGLGMLGISLLVLEGQTSASQNLNPYGLMALLSASLLWSIGSLYSRQADMPKVSLYNINIQMLSGGFILLMISVFSQEAQTVQWSQISTLSFLSLIYLIFFGSIVAYSAYIWLLKEVSPSLVSSYAFVNPVVAVVLGWLFAGEILSLQSVVAGAIIVLAVILLNYKKRG